MARKKKEAKPPEPPPQVVSEPAPKPDIFKLIRALGGLR